MAGDGNVPLEIERVQPNVLFKLDREDVELAYYQLAWKTARLRAIGQHARLFPPLLRAALSEHGNGGAEAAAAARGLLWEKLKRYSRALAHPLLPATRRNPEIVVEGPHPLPSLRDLDRLKKLHNRFEGERVFLIGNGPSLNRTPLRLLEDEYTWGLNRIYLLFDRIDWRPRFFTAFDLRVVPDNADEIDALDIEYKFFATCHRKTLTDRSNHYWYLDNSYPDDLDNRFAYEAIYSGFGGGGTVMTLAIQLAFFLGFDPIYLIGVDADYKIPSTVKQSGPDKFDDGVLLNLESTEDDDPNHFDPRYFGKGKKWHNPNVPLMIRGFELCRAAIEKRGRRIYNATVGGKLEVLPRVDLRDLF